MIDNDDCLENENLCGPHGVCLNVDGSFECDCQMGFVTTDDRKACKGKTLGSHFIKTGKNNGCKNRAESIYKTSDKSIFFLLLARRRLPIRKYIKKYRIVFALSYQENCIMAPHAMTYLNLDIDECAFENICVNGRCHNVPGTFNCKCLDG